jgi:hypothetical protein
MEKLRGGGRPGEPDPSDALAEHLARIDQDLADGIITPDEHRRLRDQALGLKP